MEIRSIEFKMSVSTTNTVNFRIATVNGIIAPDMPSELLTRLIESITNGATINRICTRFARTAQQIA